MIIQTPPAYVPSASEGNTTQSEALPNYRRIHRRAVASAADNTANTTSASNRETAEENDGVSNGIVSTVDSTIMESYRPDHDSNRAELTTTQSLQSHENGIALEEVRCSLMPYLPAVWSIKAKDISLSNLAATILIKEKLLKSSDLKMMNYLQQNSTERKSFEPTDPISGILSAAHGTVGGVLMGLADYPIEIARMIKEDKSLAKGMAANFATDKGKGVSRIVGTGLRAPMDYTMALTKGFHNLPKAYGDKTVRQFDRVTNLQSGLSVAGKSFGYGLYDGITGLITQPVKGAQKGGKLGAVKGIGKGLGGLMFKPVAGACGLPAYTFRGVYEEIHKKRGTGDPLRDDMLKAQGLEEWMSSTAEVRDQVVTRWYEIHECQKYN